uniref:MYB family transcription factor n=1 Tax=Melilotus albus TaxID=47082 RepID=A0A896WCA4_MELAB|nr:MYB family transcription factor [Melilotus albus]
MEFDLDNQGKQPKLLNLFPEYPCLKREIHTSQSSVLVPPPQNNPLLNYHLNPNFHDHFLNVPDNRNMLKGPLSPNMHAIHLYGMSLSLSSIISQSFEAINFLQRGYLHTLSVTDINIAYVIKKSWTTDEDMELVKLVKQHGLKKWSQIARSMNGGRDAKQCRERWRNHLFPNIKKDSWTPEEDMILIKTHWKVGNKWAEISKRLSGRSENSIKNRWNSTKRRQNVRMKRKCNHHSNDGSLLYEYIKLVTLAEKTAKDSKMNTSEMKMKMLGDGNEDLARLLL